MNIFKTYPHNDISDGTLHKRHAELLAIGICRGYFEDDYLWTQFNHQYYHGVNSVKDLLQLIYNNKEFAKDIYDITEDNIVSDDNDFSLTIKRGEKEKETTMVIDFKAKKITGFKGKNWTYDDKFVLIEKKKERKILLFANPSE